MKNYYFVLKDAPGPAYRVVYLKLPNRFRTTRLNKIVLSSLSFQDQIKRSN